MDAYQAALHAAHPDACPEAARTGSRGVDLEESRDAFFVADAHRVDVDASQRWLGSPPLKDEMLFNADRPCRRASQARPEVRYSYGVTHRRSLESLSNKKDKRGDECRERFSTEYYRHSTGVI